MRSVLITHKSKSDSLTAPVSHIHIYQETNSHGVDFEFGSRGSTDNELIEKVQSIDQAKPMRQYADCTTQGSRF